MSPSGILVSHGESVLMPTRNILSSMVHGMLVGVGLILFSNGAKCFPAAELSLLSLVEVVGGVVVSGAIMLDSVGMRFRGQVVPTVRK